MRIYLSYPSNVSNSQLQTIKNELASSLKKYYGLFEPSCIWLYPQDGRIAVHVMDSAKANLTEAQRDAIKEAMQKKIDEEKTVSLGKH